MTIKNLSAGKIFQTDMGALRINIMGSNGLDLGKKLVAYIIQPHPSTSWRLHCHWKDFPNLPFPHDNAWLNSKDAIHAQRYALSVLNGVLQEFDPELLKYADELHRVEIGMWQWHGEPSHCANVLVDGVVVDTALRRYYWLDMDGNHIDPDEYDGELGEPHGETLEFGDDEVEWDAVDDHRWIGLRALAGVESGMYDHIEQSL